MGAFRQQVNAFIDANLSPTARSRILANTARQGVRDLIASGQASPGYDLFVDGHRAQTEDGVRGDGGGVIRYQFNYMGAAAAFALSFLQARSPSRSGEFRQSFYVGVDGRFIPASAFSAQSVPGAAEVVIGNTQPQSRRIDVQFVGSKPLHFSVPAGMFDDAVRAVRARFGGAVTARRIYSLRFPGQYVLRRGATRGQPVQSPALVLRQAGA